jgi:putative ABC transport system substrate-binding protein
MNKIKYLCIDVARRKWLTAGAAWAALPRAGAARAQTPEKIRRIGLLTPSFPSVIAPYFQAFRLGLRERGWVEGKNISIEYRYGEGRSELVPELAADLVRLKVDVIVTSNTLATVAAQKATWTIPIVVAIAGNPVEQGLVKSLARPAGNVTGLSQMSYELTGKRLELLKEMIPRLSGVAVLREVATNEFSWKEMQPAARQLGVHLYGLEVRGASDFDKAFEEATKARVGALFILSSPIIVANLKPIADLAAKSRFPSIFQASEFAEAGGLVTYGPDRVDMFRRAATYVDKILKGAKPADLPVEQPTKFELVVNVKTAKAIGLSIPQNVLLRANRVID